MVSKIFLLFVFLLIFFSHNSSSVVIKGFVYDLELNKMKDVILEINSSPEQTYISKDGYYFFEVSKGKYSLSAKTKELYATDILTASEEGIFTKDLILFPSFDEEEFLFNETLDEFEKDSFPVLIYFFLAMIFFILVFFLLRKNKQPEINMFEKIVDNPKANSLKLDDLAFNIINFVKKEQGRVTQKEIREQFPLSEAKISLIISELEEKGFVEKIKKGRGNVIIVKA